MVSALALLVSIAAAIFAFRQWKTADEQRKTEHEAAFRPQWVFVSDGLLNNDGQYGVQPDPIVRVEHIGEGRALGLTWSFGREKQGPLDSKHGAVLRFPDWDLQPGKRLKLRWTTTTGRTRRKTLRVPKRSPYDRWSIVLPF